MDPSVRDHLTRYGVDLGPVLDSLMPEDWRAVHDLSESGGGLEYRHKILSGQSGRVQHLAYPTITREVARQVVAYLELGPGSMRRVCRRLRELAREGWHHRCSVAWITGDRDVLRQFWRWWVEEDPGGMIEDFMLEHSPALILEREAWRFLDWWHETRPDRPDEGSTA